MRPLRVLLQGGLGNQLFIIIASEVYRQQYSREVVLDVGYMKSGFTQRDSALEKISFPFRIESRESQGFEVLARRLALKALRSLRGWGFQNSTYYSPEEVGFDPSFISNPGWKLAMAYFQSWRYAEIGNISLKDISPNGEYLSSRFEELRIRIANEKPVIVHIRRGDLLSLSNTFGVLSTDYFTAGLKLILQQYPESGIWIFTDGEKNTIPGLNRLAAQEIFDCNSELSDLECFFLMRESDKFVISNSTFSWWAAFLAEKTKIVIAPKNWYRNLIEPTDLKPIHWIQIDSSWELI